MKLELNRLLLIVFTIGALQTFAQKVDIQSTLDKKQIMIGDAIRLQLQASYDPQQYIVQLPSIPDSIHHFECVTRGKPDTISERNRTILRQEIRWTNFDSGTWVLPALKFNIQPKNGDSSFIQLSDSFIVKVNTMAVDTSKPIKPIMGIRAAKRPLTDYLQTIGMILIGLAILIAFIWVCVRWYKKMKAAKVSAPAQPVLTPYEQALHDFQQLQIEAGYSKGEEKKYHSDITDTLKKYMQQQFGLDCFEKTSTEIMQSVKKQKAMANIRQELREVLEIADIVKFAKGTLNTEEHQRSLDLAIQVVKESYKKFQQQQKTTEGPRP